MNKLFSKAIIAFTALFCFLGSGAQITDSTTLPGIEVKIFDSKILGEKRKLRIQTPKEMNAWDAHPVLYVLDGEAQTTLAAGQVQYLSESYKIIPHLVVVGIENTDRMRDLTPTHSILGPDGKLDTSANNPFKNSGGGEKFLQFMKEELMPYIEQRYHTAPYKILAGHSLGGLMAVHCLLQHPDYFNAYIAISPSLQWDGKVLLTQWQNSKKEMGRILFFSDANEDSLFHANQLEFESILKQKNIKGLKYARGFYPGETHISEPVKAFYDGIRFVYPSWHLPYNSSAFRKTMNSKIIKEHFAALTKTYGYNVVPLHDDLISISRFLRNDPARINDAVELLLWNTVNYPFSSISWETLGDTYLKLKDEGAALTAYNKAAVLDPAKEVLKQKIASIGK